MGALAKKRVDYSDELFFIIWTHGGYSGSYSESYAGLSAHPDGYLLPADHYREKMDYIVSQSGITKIGSLVEACYSGWFAYRLNKAPYLTISSGDKDKLTYGNLAGERFFLGRFWDHIEWGDDAYLAYIGAKSWTHFLNDLFGKPRQNPKYFNNLPGDFMFFD